MNKIDVHGMEKLDDESRLCEIKNILSKMDSVPIDIPTKIQKTLLDETEGRNLKKNLVIKALGYVSFTNSNHLAALRRLIMHKDTTMFIVLRDNNWKYPTEEEMGQVSQETRNGIIALQILDIAIAILCWRDYVRD